MAKIFDWDARKGTLIDSVSKTKGTLTAGTGGFKKTEKGTAMLFDGVDTEMVIPTQTFSDGDAQTLVFASKTKLPLSSFMIPFGSDGNNNSIYIYDNGYNFVFRSGTEKQVVSGSDTTILFDGRWHLVVMTIDTSKTINLYIDNDLNATDTLTTSDIVYDNIGEGIDGDHEFRGHMAYTQIYDTALSQSERNDFMVEFNHSYGITEQKRNFTYPKATDLSSEVGLVAAYNFIPSNGKLIDISGNGNDGTISGALSTKDGMAFDGVDDYIDCGAHPTVGDNFTWSTRIKYKAKGSNNPFFQSDESNDNYVIRTSSTNVFEFRIYGRETLSSGYTLVDGLYYNLTVVRTDRDYDFYVNGSLVGSDTASLDIAVTGDLRIGIYTNAFGLFEMEDLKLYNYAFTPQQAKDYHNSFKKLTYRNTFADDGADGIVKTPRGWIKGTGTFSIQEQVEDIL